MQVVLIIITLLLIIGSVGFMWIFYPKQQMPIGKIIDVITPGDKYKNDCLHPCIRYIPEGFAGYKYWMVQTPFYGFSDKLENPILYKTNILSEMKNGIVVCETPSKGYNSDPTLFFDKDRIYVFWREFETPFCDSFNCSKVIVGVYTFDGETFSEKKAYLFDNTKNGDTIQCPCIIKTGKKYHFYTMSYDYGFSKKNKGMIIWEGTSLLHPDFKMKCISLMQTVYTCDKWKQKKLWNQLFFISKPLKHDFWHFDLFEYNNHLYMLSTSEWSDNVILSISDDYVHFKTYLKPLVNIHYTEQFINYRPSFYKPTGFISDNIFHLFYTSTPYWKKSTSRNILYMSTKDIKALKIK